VRARGPAVRERIAPAVARDAPHFPEPEAPPDGLPVDVPLPVDEPSVDEPPEPVAEPLPGEPIPVPVSLEPLPVVPEPVLGELEPVLEPPPEVLEPDEPVPEPVPSDPAVLGSVDELPDIEPPLPVDGEPDDPVPPMLPLDSDPVPPVLPLDPVDEEPALPPEPPEADCAHAAPTPRAEIAPAMTSFSLHLMCVPPAAVDGRAAARLKPRRPTGPSVRRRRGAGPKLHTGAAPGRRATGHRRGGFPALSGCGLIDGPHRPRTRWPTTWRTAPPTSDSRTG
jgi:hypothetical protein